MKTLVGALAAPALALFGAAFLAPRGVAQGVGEPAPAVELVDFAQTRAKSFDDYAGRLVLIEFFAYW